MKINDMTFAEVAGEMVRIADRRQVGQAAELHVDHHPTRGLVVVVIDPGSPAVCKLIELDHDDFDA